jgi:hypothetical protein
VPFRITFGTQHGADPRRLLAVVCRRGGIAGNQVGAIRVGELWSTFQVAEDVAHEFERAAAKPDARDPRVRIDRWLPPEQRPARRPRADFDERPAREAPPARGRAAGHDARPAHPRSRPAHDDARPAHARPRPAHDDARPAAPAAPRPKRMVPHKTPKR